MRRRILVEVCIDQLPIRSSLLADRFAGIIGEADMSAVHTKVLKIDDVFQHIRVVFVSTFVSDRMEEKAIINCIDAARQEWGKQEIHFVIEELA